MATKIVTKNSSTGGAVPSASDLVQGELAVNVADKRLFTEDNGGSIIELGTNPSTIDINAGSIDGTAIGASSASTGAFTTLTATGLTVQTSQGDISIPSGTSSFNFARAGTNYIRATDASGAFSFITGANDFATQRLNIANNGDISFYEDTGTTAKLFWDASAESLGIGTSSPVARLEVHGAFPYSGTVTSLSTSVTKASARIRGSSDASTSLYFGSLGNDAEQYIQASNDSGTGADDIALNPYGGNVSMGSGASISPDADADNLVIQENGAAGITIGSSASSVGSIRFADSGSPRAGMIYYNHVGNEMRFYTNASERARIDSSGNVGIGETSPSTPLHVNSGTGNIAATFASTDAGSYINIKDNGSGTFGAMIGAVSDDIVFSPNNVESMRIDSSGNLLVGTTSGTSLSNTGFRYINSGTSSYAEFVRTTTSDASANVYISRGNDGRALLFYRNDVPSTVGSVTLTTSSTAYNTSSDQRLKENIADADDAGSKIDAIQVRKFDWKVDGSHQDYGMIAQELVEVAPEAVTVPTDSEEMMGVDYSKLVPMLIKEIQSLRNRVAQLEE